MGTPFEIMLGLRRMSRQFRSIGSPTSRDCHDYLNLLKKCGAVDGFPSHVETKLVVNTGFASRTPSEKEEWLKHWLRLEYMAYFIAFHPESSILMMRHFLGFFFPNVEY